MSQSFYRFRSIAALLGDFQELERQEIYFSHPDKLNDAMEGFCHTVWRGDRILWRNFLRHYLLVLLETTQLVLLGGQNFTVEWMNNSVWKVDSDLPDAPIRQILKDIEADFFAQPVTGSWIEGLSKRDLALSRSELAGYLALLHPIALHSVFSSFERQNITVTDPPLNFGSLQDDLANGLQARFDANDIAPDGTREAILSAVHYASLEIAIMQDASDEGLQARLPTLLLMRDFPDSYLQALEAMLAPKWYTASFVKEPKNAAMWGVYGDGHRGVCLEFRSSPDADGKPTINLNGPVQSVHEFEPVVYASDYPEREFFRSLGVLPRFKLRDYWYSDNKGTISSFVQDVLLESDEWRSAYWRRHGQSITTKLPQWDHEEEYRLVRTWSISTSEGEADQKVSYCLNDLAGVIFGIKTAQSDKIAIFKTLQDKANVVGGANIAFYQAVYSKSTGQIEIHPLPLLTRQIST